MSKQLAISACASVFAMAAFALSASPLTGLDAAQSAQDKGAITEVTAPSPDRFAAAVFD